MKRLLVITLFTLLFSLEGIAQNGGFAGASMRLGFGPRAMSMGNAYTAVTSEGIYSYYNPALTAVETSDSRQFDLVASSLQFDRVFQSIGTKFDLPPKAGLAIALIRTGVKDIDERSLSGYPLGTFDLSEYQLLTSFGINLSSKLNAGISFKLGYADYHPELSPETSVGIDLGALYHFNDHLNLGIAIQDIFGSYSWNSSELYGLDQSRNVINNFPTRYKLGLAWQQEEFTISGEFEIQSYTSEVTNTELFVTDNNSIEVFESISEINTSSSLLKLGAAWNAHERFTLRGGYRITDMTSSGSNSFSTGFSVHLPFDTLSPSIDYAFITEPYQVANMHVFALRLHL